MESQPCRGTGSPLTDQVGWDWTKWPQVGVWGLSPGQFLFLRQPWCYFLFSLSFPFLLSPPPPQAWPSPPQPCLWAFLHLEIRSRSDMSPPSTSWPRGPASPTPSGALWQQSPPSPEMVGPPWGSASCIPRGRRASCQEGVCLLFLWLSLFSHIHLTWGSFWSPDMPSWLHLLLTGAEKSSLLWF